MDIAHAGEGGVRLAGKRNHLKTMAPDGWDKTQNFVRLSREAKREKYIARRDHAEVAMHGLNRIKHDRARTGGSENRAHLFGDGEVLAYASHDDNTLRRNAIEHKRDRLGETFAEGFAGAAQPLDFYIEDFAGSSQHFVVGHSFLVFLVYLVSLVSLVFLVHFVVDCRSVTQIVPTISSAEHPRERSFMAFARPCKFGPMASASPSLWAIL